MRLFVLGATGGTGRALVEQSLARGHDVTAFVRSPDKLPLRHEKLAVVAGDPRDAEQLKKVLPGHNAVLSALGHRTTQGGPSTIVRDSARSTISAMRDTGIRRLLVVSVAFLFPDAGFVAAILRNLVLRSVGADAIAMERAVAESGLDWTIVRPPRLTNGPHTGHYRAEDGHLPRNGFSVSRADVAHFILDELERPAHVGKIVGVV